MKKEKTILIVGAGVAGLAAGGFLAQQGFPVKIFEAQDHLGGCCSTTTLDGYTFNNGAMMVIMPGMLDYTFARLGVERTSLLPLRRIQAPQRSFLENGVTVTLLDGMDVRVEGGRAASQPAEDLARLVKKWQPVYRVFSDLLIQPFSPAAWVRKAWRYLPKFAGTAASELKALVRDENLRAALAGHMAYAGVDLRRLPAPTLLALVVMLTEGYFIPEGGMGSLPRALARVFEGAGGEIVLNARVTRIAVGDGGVTGLEVDGHGFVTAGAVLSTASGMSTFRTLVAAEWVPAALARRAREARLSMKAFYLQLGTTNRLDIDSHLNYILPPPGKIARYFSPGGEEVKWGLYAVPTTFMPELAPLGGSIVELSPAVRMDQPLEVWNEARIERLTEATLALLRRSHDLEIAVQRVRTPQQFQDEMHLYQGALYGLSPAVGPLGMFPYKTGIPGLYLAGQTTYPGFGVTPAAVSGILSAEALVGSGSG
ncbi:MAG: NAD(P)/FAD-dependent oxidoreductase [Anaerolineales bacterium]|nr:NAD(P)/FAD-dependent oxidoreductase [Anaerolineales bacterium]